MLPVPVRDLEVRAVADFGLLFKVMGQYSRILMSTVHPFPVVVER